LAPKLTYEDVEYAVAAQRIEGLTVSPETIEDMKRMVRGEMTGDEARAAILKRYNLPEKT